VHAFAIDPQRGMLLLIILGVAAGGALALYAWRAPALRDEAAFTAISREGSLFLNNVLLAAATAVVLIGTLLPLIRSAIDGTPISVGAPYFNLTFTALLAPALIALPAGPLLAWKRGDLAGALRRLWIAAIVALAAALLTFGLVTPRSLLAAGGIALGGWVICGALVEAADRVKAFRAPWPEVGRRTLGLPRGAWGMTLAHIGIGVFALGASFETAWRTDAAAALAPGQSMHLGAYVLRLDSVGEVFGPNFEAERAHLRVTDGSGALVCNAAPERRLYAADGQTVSGVAICPNLLDDVYVVSGQGRADAGGVRTWLIRAYWNPWVRFVFAGPLLMALGGLISLSDRRLRFAVTSRVRKAVGRTPPEAEPAPEPAE
jgi:cytochrome c-type biogenesis protein CcmF